MTTDTQSRIDTVKGASFPYQFGTDLRMTKIVIFNRVENKVMSLSPSEVQRLASDETLDPHRHALYTAAWEYWQRQS